MMAGARRHAAADSLPGDERRRVHEDRRSGGAARGRRGERRVPGAARRRRRRPAGGPPRRRRTDDVPEGAAAGVPAQLAQLRDDALRRQLRRFHAPRSVVVVAVPRRSDAASQRLVADGLLRPQHQGSDCLLLFCPPNTALLPKGLV